MGVGRARGASISRRLGGLPCGPDATGLPAIASSAACACGAGAEIALCVAGVQHLIGSSSWLSWSPGSL